MMMSQILGKLILSQQQLSLSQGMRRLLVIRYQCVNDGVSNLAYDIALNFANVCFCSKLGYLHIT